MQTLQELAAEALTRGPHYPAVERDGLRYSWEDMRGIAAQVRRLVEASGAHPRSPIGLLPANQPVLVGALIALISIGRSITMIHSNQSQAGISRDLAELKPAIVVGMADDIGNEVIGAARELGIAAIRLNAMEVVAAPGADQSTINSVAPAELQFDLLTSGTTGPPKRFPLSFELVMRDMVGVNSMSVTSAEDAASMPPLYFYLNCGTITGLYLAVPVLLLGRSGYLVDRFTVETFQDFARRYKPQSTGIPMPALQMLLDSDVPAEDLASLQCIQTGAAPLDPRVHREFEERFGIVVQLVYGATEFGGPVAMMSLDLYEEWGKDRKFGSLGKAFNGAKLRITDLESGKELPCSTQGRIEVQIERMGHDWIRTSDLGMLDEDEFLWFRGRADGAINRGGFKIHPEKVEAALRLHPAVAYVSVVGIPDERLGQVPAAAIQLQPDTPRPSPDELAEHLRQHVENTHVPAKWCIIDDMPYTATMKVDQGAVRRMILGEVPN